uniref:Alpha-galactosidase n=1 Tax=Bicosoecida sp. CB-2014 TaxID=1486930 RepID=A0A7S1CQ71_9STRA|mmetsp:Transcript_7064/g.25137  ORF Transcript_7064/g.25137 Transcript_7064/m.25137 type:complete len:544 (+) Transcript_7064:110-1741(+)
MARGGHGVAAAAAAALLVASLGSLAPALALDNGLALLPPMGWRSWNAFHGSISQDIMEATMRAMVSRNRTVDGTPTSLLDLGFDNAGLDDNWQACGKGVRGSFTAADFSPMVNTATFPDMKGMTAYAHSLGLRAGFYMNNCICRETASEFPSSADVAGHMQGRAKALAAWDFDGVKLDGCGAFRNLTWWAELINATGKAMLQENCHWGGTVPGQSGGDAPCDGTETPSDCPYNFFRTSGDIQANWASMFGNLQTTTKFQGVPPLSRPGTWAYPDMLEVGNLKDATEDRSHFGAWAVVSAPLILGHDLTNAALGDRVWPTISNKEVIAVSQDWAGHPGRLVAAYNDPASPLPHHAVAAAACGNASFPFDLAGKQAWGLHQARGVASWQACQQACCADSGCDVWQWGSTPPSPSLQCFIGKPLYLTDNPKWFASRGKDKPPPPPPGADTIQLWAKPLSGGAYAAFALSNVSPGGAARAVQISFADVFNATASGSVAVRDLYAHKDLGSFTTSFTTDAIGPHDSRMYRFTPATADAAAAASTATAQ